MTPEQLSDLKAHVTEAVRARGGHRRPTGWWEFSCPNGATHEHGDRTPSAGWMKLAACGSASGAASEAGRKDLAAWLGIPTAAAGR